MFRRPTENTLFEADKSASNDNNNSSSSIKSKEEREGGRERDGKRRKRTTEGRKGEKGMVKRERSCMKLNKYMKMVEGDSMVDRKTNRMLKEEKREEKWRRFKKKVEIEKRD